MADSTLPPDLFDQTTLVSLASTVAILTVAVAVSRRVLDPATSGSLRFLFIWHAFDALIHFCLKAASSTTASSQSSTLGLLKDASNYYPDPHNYLGTSNLVHGSQAGGENPLAQLWMVYARADKRWAGVDLVRISVAAKRAKNMHPGWQLRFSGQAR